MRKMKKNYVRPEMETVVLSDELMEVIGMGSDDTTESKSQRFFDGEDETPYSGNLWEKESALTDPEN